MATKLQFVPFASAPKVSFWQGLGQKKLEDWRLDAEPKAIVGSWVPGSVKGLPARLELVRESLAGEAIQDTLPAMGSVVVVNTLEDMKRFDKKEAALDIARRDEENLAAFLVLVYADMKKHQFTYWFTFPALVLDPPATVVSKEPLAAVLEREASMSLDAFAEKVKALPRQTVAFEASLTKKDVAPLFTTSSADLYCCMDPSTTEDPGWPVRNLITLLRRKKMTRVRIACCRGDVLNRQGLFDCTPSFVMEVEIPPPATTDDPKATGWERDSEGRHRPRCADLAPLTDPAELATSAANLNLHLMRWRLLPSLDVDMVASTKCLLLGAGTLGCQVARCLVGWGVRYITFVDNGKVSYSNPARQSLFTVHDAAEGKKKADAAAKALYDIAPGTPSAPSTFTGVDLTIPMPGHTIIEEADDSVVRKLESLVDSHDVIFILTDTREARWLPTLLATASPRKPTVVNVGLGLDSYVVIRHGADADLGCYFCNDVVAPGDSTKDRTLDQQCTVSRPGLAPVAASVASELAISLLHHPQRYAAPADHDQQLSYRPENPLGIIPHSVRGFLTHFSSIAITCRKFPKCSACSDAVVNHYQSHGPDFIRDVATDPSLLERISGLADLADDLGDADAFVLDDDDDLTVTDD